jgi:hypothetical protein
LGHTGSGPSQGRNVKSLARRTATRYPDLAVLLSILPRTTPPPNGRGTALKLASNKLSLPLKTGEKHLPFGTELEIHLNPNEDDTVKLLLLMDAIAASATRFLHASQYAGQPGTQAPQRRG